MLLRILQKSYASIVKHIAFDTVKDMIRKIVICFSHKALFNVYNDNHRAGFKDFWLLIFIENTLNMLNHYSLFEINIALYFYSMVNQKDGQVDHFDLAFREQT